MFSKKAFRETATHRGVSRILLNQDLNCAAESPSPQQVYICNLKKTKVARTLLGSKQRSETLGFRCFLCCQHSQRSGDQALGPNGSELAGAASDLSRRARLTEGEPNNTPPYLHQSRARVGRRSSVVGRRSSVLGPRSSRWRQRLRLRMSPLDAQESGSSRIRTPFSRQTNTASRPLPFLHCNRHQSLHLQATS